jgi:hypothetical protein
MPPTFESAAPKIQVRNISSAIIDSVVPYSAGEENNRLLRNIKVFITTYTTAYSLTLSGDSAVWSVVRLAILKALLLPTHVFWGVKLSCHVPKGFGLQCGRDRAVGEATRYRLDGPGIESR